MAPHTGHSSQLFSATRERNAKAFSDCCTRATIGTTLRSRYARDVRFHTLSLRGTLVNSEQLNEAVSERPTPTQTIVAADELLIVDLIPFCQQHIAQVTRAFQNVATTTVSVDFKCSLRKIETQRQLRTREELPNHEIAFGGYILGSVSARSSRVRTARTADSTVVFKRP